MYSGTYVEIVDLLFSMVIGVESPGFCRRHTHTPKHNKKCSQRMCGIGMDRREYCDRAMDRYVFVDATNFLPLGSFPRATVVPLF
jgi:hypothetical protein